MNDDPPQIVSIWSTLGIDASTDGRTIRRAYAARLRELELTDKSEISAFERLRTARDAALALVDIPGHTAPTPIPLPASDSAGDLAGKPRTTQFTDVRSHERDDAEIDAAVSEVMADSRPFAPVDRAIAHIATLRNEWSVSDFERFEIALAEVVAQRPNIDIASLAKIARQMQWDDVVRSSNGPSILRDHEFRLSVDSALRRTDVWKPAPRSEAPWHTWALITLLTLASFAVLAAVFFATTREMRAASDSSMSVYPLIAAGIVLGRMIQKPAYAAFNGDTVDWRWLVLQIVGLLGAAAGIWFAWR